MDAFEATGYLSESLRPGKSSTLLIANHLICEALKNSVCVFVSVNGCERERQRESAWMCVIECVCKRSLMQHMCVHAISNL